MLVRCTNDGLMFEVPDDMVGMNVQCPECGNLIRVGPESEHVQAKPPSPRPNVPANLENHIYDGMPPLSVMMALRRGKGPSYDDDELLRRYPMTVDDWKALAAFETVLYAVASLELSLILVPIAALGMIVPTLLTMKRDLPPAGCVYLAMVCAMMLCWLTMLRGRRSLGRIEVGSPTDLLLWVIAGMIGLLAMGICLQLLQLGTRTESFEIAGATLLGLALSLLAIFDLVKTSVRVWRALNQIEPPEVTSRLVDALKFLN